MRLKIGQNPTPIFCDSLNEVGTEKVVVKGCGTSFIDRVPMSLIRSKQPRNKRRSLLNWNYDKPTKVVKVSTKIQVAKTVPTSYTLTL